MLESGERGIAGETSCNDGGVPGLGGLAGQEELAAEDDASGGRGQRRGGVREREECGEGEEQQQAVSRRAAPWCGALENSTFAITGTRQPSSQ